MGGALTVLVLAASAAYVVTRYDSDDPPEPHCAVAGRSGETAFTMEHQQAANAATIEAVGSARGLSEQAVAIALATAMQESKLLNIDYGDRDSVGLCQQRPSQGWGSVEQIMDPVYAAGMFYDHLVEVPDYESLPLTEAAQAVQRSAFPDAYAQHEDEAVILAAVLTGRRAAALSCVVDVDAEPVAGRPAEIRERIDRQFGGQVPVSGDGATLTCPAGAEGEPGQGWELAHWAVAHAAELGIERIDYGQRVWEAERSEDGWREATEEDGLASGAAAGTEIHLSTRPRDGG
jgi:hypothetical protein